MRQRTRGWIMPEADMLSMLRLIDERYARPRSTCGTAML
jgi:hypothetical protein